MRLRSAALVVTIAAAALLAGCDGDRTLRISTNTSGDEPKGVLKVVTALQCPDSMGQLTRKGSAQADGAVCSYVGPRGTEVSLHLVAVDSGAPEQALRDFESRLAALMPATLARMSATDAAEKAEAARRDAEAARADAEAAQADAGSAEASSAEAGSADAASVILPGMTVNTDGDRASVHMPGIHIEAHGDAADVRIGGLTIRADGDRAQIAGAVTTPAKGGEPRQRESVDINARDNAAEIRTRTSGEATRQTYLLTDQTPSSAGWRMVGYEARGPRGGPIVVATIRAKDRNNDAAFDDAKALVTLNVGE